MDTRKNFENRAALHAGRAASENDCERCGDPLIFAMQDRQHQFSLGLVTVLQCLRVAEREGFVPALPPGNGGGPLKDVTIHWNKPFIQSPQSF